MDDTCTNCGAPVRTILLESGRVRLLDPAVRPDGTCVVVTQPGGLVRGRILTGWQLPAQQAAYRVHDCPPAVRPGPPCAICGRPMPRGIAVTLRWTAHPGCELLVPPYVQVAKPPPPRPTEIDPDRLY
jgi:hypothetical protein